MSDYVLYYWPIPFRGQFIRAVLAHVGASWEERGFDEIVSLKSAPPEDQPIPHMGPPVLVDGQSGTSLSQMPAILIYLGEQHGLMADDPAGRALTLKIILDANDVLYEMTRYNGDQMWTPESWRDFQPRLKRWMELFEETGTRNGLSAKSGFVLGTDAPGLADLVVATLWGPMTDKLPPLRPILDETAPAIARLADRISALPEQVDLRRRSDEAYGKEWCSGQIEESLRAVL
jgi:glutathione S-transferase